MLFLFNNLKNGENNEDAKTIDKKDKTDKSKVLNLVFKIESTLFQGKTTTF